MFSLHNLIYGALLLVVACTPATPPETAGFVYRLGVDTVAVASVTWSKDKAQGVYVNRVPVTTVVRWNADVDEKGKVHRLERVHTTGDSITERVLITLANDSATIQRQAGDSTTTRRFAAAPVAVPRHPSTDAGLLELQTRQVVASGMDMVMGESFSTGDTMVTYDTTRRVAPDTIVVPGPRLVIDSVGRILKFNENERTTVDIEALVTAFNSRPLGELSPRDSVAATISGAHVSVAYGSPRKRGRAVFGALVPWDRPWRTGANNATFFTTDQAIRAGSIRVPAGKYSVFTIPGQQGWTLLLSSNLGDNAAVYDSTTIVARIPMQSGPAATPAERLTFDIAADGMLRVSWDTVAASVQLRR
ncbi:MAG TPA: DUF2911 domain-containing protein [Gemmatimonadales bacterium]|nr:DUF2911 domain-containing protein [Gemmatimonadales bacterium]